MMHNVIPKPLAVMPAQGAFIFSPATRIVAESPNDDLKRIANFLAENLKTATGIAADLSESGASTSKLVLQLVQDSSLGDEGYELRVTPDGITLQANQPAGLFYAAQTLRQLVPATAQGQKVDLAAVTIRDVPRFAWRGTMLDVARHFFNVQDVKTYIDVLAFYKLNRLHLHLSDDQGWRIEIKSWENLAKIGGSTQVVGGAGGYYTQEQYRDLVEYAAQRYIMIIPEIDTPSHINAALASYAELNADETARELYTGTDVGFSSLAIDQAITYEFMDDVIRELAALTPAPYLHIGGDEAWSTPKEAYIRFIERIEPIVHAHGKQMIGWEEIAQAKISPSTLVQQWKSDLAAKGVQQGARIIMSPASRTYLDMKYDDSTPLGLNWAGNVDVMKSYTWDPATEIKGVNESDIVGIEAPLWSETLLTLQDIEYMAFPRLISIAEISWSPNEHRAWDEFKQRLAAHGPRLQAMGVNYFASPQVWE